MMKKIVISILGSVTAVTLWAGPQSGRYAKIPLLDDHVTHAVARAQTNWQEQLRHIQTLFKQVPLKAEAQAPLPATLLPVLSYRDEQTYLRRTLQVQKSLQANPALKGYAFVAPVPTDLARLSSDNYAALHAFLKNSSVVRVIKIEQVRPFTLAVQIQGIPRGQIELWLDEPTKKVYLMSDNFYTTAAGKYGLHLK